MADERKALPAQAVGQRQRVLRDLLHGVGPAGSAHAAVATLVHEDVAEVLRVELLRERPPAARVAKPAVQGDDGMRAVADAQVGVVHGVSPGNG